MSTATELRVAKGGRLHEIVDITLDEMLAGVVFDLVLNRGTLNLENVDGVSYEVAVISFGDDTTHTYVTGPKMGPKLVSLASELIKGTDPREALIGFPGDVVESLKERQLELVRMLTWAPLTRFVARWLHGQADLAIELLESSAS